MATTIADPSWAIPLDNGLAWVDGGIALDWDESELWVALGPGTPTLTVPHIGPTGTLYAPTLTVGPVTITLPHIGPTGTLYEPSISVGGVTIVVPHIGPTSTLYEPTVTSGGITLTLPHIGPTGALYEPTITTGSVTIVLPHIGPTGELHAPVIIGPQSITVPHIGPTGVLYAFVITGGEQSLDSHTNKLTIRIRRTVILGRRNVQARTWQEAGDYAHPWDVKVIVDGTACDGNAYTGPQITVTDLYTGAAVTEWASAKTTGITPGDGTTYSWQVQGESDDFGALAAGAYKLKLTASPGLVHSWRHDVT